LKQVIRDLLDLHLVEVRIETLESFLGSVPARESELASERAAAQGEVDRRREELHQAREELKRKERSLGDGEEKLRQLQVKLNQVKTNKEYEAALKEIEDQRRANGVLEEEILLLLDQVESAERAERELLAGWEDKVREFEARESELASLSGKAGRELEERKVARDKLLSALAPELTRQFEKIRKAKGRALVRADQEVCHGCHRRLPPQLYNEVLKGERALTCPNCERFLVHSESELEDGLLELEP